MALSECWQKLPLELTCGIIEQTDDACTLERWMRSYRPGTVLHHKASQRRCRRMTINYLNLSHDSPWSNLVDPDDDDNKEDQSETPDFDSLTNTWLRQTMNGFIPASYTKELVFELNNWNAHRVYEDQKWMGVQLRHLPIRSTSEDLETTLRLVLPSLSILRSLALHGPLTQRCLNTIKRWLPETCEELALGSNSRSSPLMTSWRSLTSMPQLRVLKISSIIFTGVPSLVLAVAELETLEELWIDVFSMYEDEVLDELLFTMFPTLEGEQTATCRLPSSIRVLSLGYPENEILPLNSRKVMPKLPSMCDRPKGAKWPRLEKLFLKSPLRDTLDDIYACFQRSPVSSVAVPAFFKPSPDTFRDHRRSIHLDDSVSDWFPPTLQEITYFGIGLASGTTTPLIPALSGGSRFEVTSLVIGARIGDFLRARRDLENLTDEMLRELPFLFSREDTAGLALWDWIRDESTIRHLSLEQVDLHTLEPADIELNEHHNLRVLMLYPWPYQRRGHAESDNNNELPDPRFFRNPPTREDRMLLQGELQASVLPPTSSSEERLLTAIINDAPPHLRVVYIGGYRIWLSRKPDESGTWTVVPLPLAQAKVIGTERLVMNKVLREGDWDFMDSVPEQPWDSGYFGGSNHWAEIDPEEAVERNYCVLRRKEDFEPTEEDL